MCEKHSHLYWKSATTNQEKNIDWFGLWYFMTLSNCFKFVFLLFFFLLLSFRILIDEDADLLAVNNEGEVPLDLAEEDEMDEYISEVMDEKGKTSNN